MRLVKNLILILIVSLGISCGGDDNDEMPSEVILENPTAVSLNFPANNTECNEGEILSDSRSEVIFKWIGAVNNDSYTVYLKNLETDVTKNYNTTLEELPISILRGVPYSWWVVSKVTGNSETAESPIWKFYNAGLPKESYPPFPADVVSPVMGSAINSGTITLKWEGADVDGDIASYTILLDNSEIPTTSIGNPTTNAMNVDVESGKIYYWKVITIDANGNSSDSEIFQFKVN
tara:strand:+ start:27 stop:728 length:702 start_codon:yes stop_codon:yes gene_type:complete